jgi:rsbT co-antagonist protein RsbR
MRAMRRTMSLGLVDSASFVLALKQPLFSQFRKSVSDVNTLAEETWTTTLLLDSLGLYTMEVFQKSREGVITRQQQELLELSTPALIFAISASEKKDSLSRTDCRSWRTDRR